MAKPIAPQIPYESERQLRLELDRLEKQLRMAYQTLDTINGNQKWAEAVGRHRYASLYANLEKDFRAVERMRLHLGISKRRAAR